MATPVQFPYERDLPEFDRTVAAAQREIILQIKLALREGNLQRERHRRLQLARVLAVLDQLGAYVDPAARRMVADAYDQAADRAASQIAGLAINAPEIPGAFAGVSREAVAALQDSVEASMREGRARIGRQVNDLYAKAGRRAATRAVLGADGSPRTAARRMVADLMLDKQIASMVDGPGFIDAAGRKWSLDRYSTMVVRTTTREAVVQGAVDRMTSHGVDLARVSMHASACHICAPYEGRLVDLGGSTRDFDGEAVMTGPMPPFHPNCRHSLAPFSSRVERMRREMNEKPAPSAQAPVQGWDLDTSAVSPKALPAVQQAARAVAKVHGVPAKAASLEIRAVPKRGRSSRTKAAFVRTRAGDESWVEVRPGTSPLTVAHELGHALDFRVLGDGRRTHSEGARRPNERARLEATAPEGLETWWESVTNSEAFRATVDDRKLGFNYKQYLLSSVEQFARSYAQWIALRSGDESMLAEVRAILDGAKPGYTPTSQWEDDDFAPIAEALDGIFEHAGLRRAAVPASR